MEDILAMIRRDTQALKERIGEERYKELNAAVRAQPSFTQGCIEAEKILSRPPPPQDKEKK